MQVKLLQILRASNIRVGEMGPTTEAIIATDGQQNPGETLSYKGSPHLPKGTTQKYDEPTRVLPLIHPLHAILGLVFKFEL